MCRVTKSEWDQGKAGGRRGFGLEREDELSNLSAIVGRVDMGMCASSWNGRSPLMTLSM